MRGNHSVCDWRAELAGSGAELRYDAGPSCPASSLFLAQRTLLTTFDGAFEMGTVIQPSQPPARGVVAQFGD